MSGWLERPSGPPGRTGRLACRAEPVGRMMAAALPRVPPSPMLNRSPTAGATGKTAVAVRPPSSSGLGHRPFKAAARVRIPLGVRLTNVCGRRAQRIVCDARLVEIVAVQLVEIVAVQHGPVEQLGVLATLSRWRSRVQIPSGPLRSAGLQAARRGAGPAGAGQGQVAQLARASA